MAVHACLLVFLAAAALGGAADLPEAIDETPLIVGDPVLADVNQLLVVLATGESPSVAGLIDGGRLETQVSRKLHDAGLATAEGDSESTPKLLVHIEGVEVPASDQYVYRVQTALCRLVTAPGRGDRRILVEVWRVRPVMAAVPQGKAGDAICSAVLVQAEAFVEARNAARRLSDAAQDSSGSAVGDRSQPTPQAAGPGGEYPFVASKSSDVFHRADCRWAQNISPDKLVRYKNREEAVQSGKRPCKSCKP